METEKQGEKSLIFKVTFMHPPIDPQSKCKDSPKIIVSEFAAQNKDGARILAENFRPVCHFGCRYELHSVEPTNPD